MFRATLIDYYFEVILDAKGNFEIAMKIKRILTIFLAYIPAAFVVASVLLVTLLKWAPVTCTPLMLARGLHNMGNGAIIVKYKWTPLEEISDEMIKAVIASEDQKFLLHNEFYFDEIAWMKQEHMFDSSPVRGCSTISQQTEKNCFTFCTHTWLRKGIEAYYTVLIEKIWGKRRIMEVYLNVAELGPEIYGVEAASRKYYHIHASNLTMADATSLACCLPNPLHRNPMGQQIYGGQKNANCGIM